mmetsp:Transcript_7542/g.12297  ORF Transcript_7542/g.12297 Transcript_7542/m.12297 type:complete len:93 (+) Transcript_7542:770-1048(+)
MKAFGHISHAARFLSTSKVSSAEVQAAVAPRLPSKAHQDCFEPPRDMRRPTGTLMPATKLPASGVASERLENKDRPDPVAARNIRSVRTVPW